VLFISEHLHDVSNLHFNKLHVGLNFLLFNCRISSNIVVIRSRYPSMAVAGGGSYRH